MGYPGVKYQPLYEWSRTQIDENDPPTDFDWVGWDGPHIIGRIRKEIGGPMNGKWQWSGQGPHTRERILPQQGYCSTAREGSRMVEDYYHRLMRHNGLRGSKDEC